MSISSSKSATHPVHVLLIVNSFTSEIYTYLMEKRTLLSKKLKIFYEDIEPKREKINDEEKMKIQTDLEFQQNEIKRLNKK